MSEKKLKNKVDSITRVLETRKFPRAIVSNKRGFSLVEMLIAMAIFVVFTGVLINSYMGIVGSLRDAGKYRILYSDARHVFDVLTEESRNSTVYGEDCNNLGFGVGDIVEFCSVDGMKKVAFKYVEGEQSLYVEKYEKRDDADGLSGGSFLRLSGEKLHSDVVKITNFKFHVWPNRNPYSTEEISVIGLFQPKITFAGTFEQEDVKGGSFKYDLQTSVSLRVYK